MLRTTVRGSRPPGVSLTPSATKSISSRTLSGTSPTTRRTLWSVAARSNGRNRLPTQPRMRSCSGCAGSASVVEEFGVPGGTAAVLGRACAAAVHAARRRASGPEHLDIMGPVVAEVVEILERRSRGRPAAPGSRRAGLPATPRRWESPVGRVWRDELVQMRVGPSRSRPAEGRVTPAESPRRARRSPASLPARRRATPPAGDWSSLRWSSFDEMTVRRNTSCTYVLIRTSTARCGPAARQSRPGRPARPSARHIRPGPPHLGC